VPLREWTWMPCSRSARSMVERSPETVMRSSCSRESNGR
jgi:hypothetical protein